MKRSQMIEEILRVLIDTESLRLKDVAVAILDKVEKLGMQPPVESVDPVLFSHTHVWSREEELV